jgi:carnitine-CoA ligase
VSLFPSQTDVVLADLLERRATTQGDDVFIVYADEVWNYRRSAKEAWSAAQTLIHVGVQPGHYVLCWLPNGPDAIRTWFGANVAGATFAPMNTAYRGRLLEHAINQSEARVMVAHAELLDRLDGLTLPHLRTVLVSGGEARHMPGLDVISATELTRSPAQRPFLPSPIRPWDIMTLLYTSGTTGPSKGVLCTYLHHHTVGALNAPELGSADRFFVCLPLFHLSGTWPVYWLLTVGGSVAITDGFRTSAFWQEVRRYGVTSAVLMGSMANFLLQNPAQDDDRDHPLRIAACNPMIGDPEAFRRRFGVNLYANYGMTEVPVPLRTPLNPPGDGSCGTPTTDDYDLRLVDEFDVEVPDGTPGELIVRHSRPWTITVGYRGMPEETARAWRNGWFHTGDLLVRHADGSYRFLDRAKDAVRRRGENISSMEVERELLTHPLVKEAAVVGVPATRGEEEDVLAVVVPNRDVPLELSGLIEYLIPRLPYYAVPRYIRVIDQMPKTPSLKTQKYALREAGVTEDTWDREAAGILLRRERLGS